MSDPLRGWKTVPLDELCEIALGKTPARRNSSYWDTKQETDHVWLSIADLPEATDTCPVVNKSKEHVSNEGAALCKVVKAGTLMLSFKLTLGRMAVAGRDLLTNEAIAALTIRDNGEIDRDFLYWYFTYFDWHKAAENDHKIKGKTLNKAKLKALPVILPPLSEQRRIVSVLDAAFAGLATAEAHTRQNLTNARELFERRVAQLLTDAKPDSRSVLVSELAENRKGSIRTGPFGSQLLHGEFVDAGIAVLGIDNAVQNDFAWGKRRFITESKYESLKRYTVRPGDVIITIMGTCGRCAVIPDNIPTVINTKHLCCISLDRERCLPQYLHAYFLHSPDARRYLESQAKGAIMAGLNMTIIKELPVTLPSLDSQREIIETIDGVKDSTRRLEARQERKLVALAALKQSLLHRAFRGELTANEQQPVEEPYLFPTNQTGITSTELYTGIVAYAYQYHVDAGEEAKFGHVKAEKTVHLAEAHLGFDLGRQPIRNAAGPDDTPRRLEVEQYAREHGYYDFRHSDDGIGYRLYPLAQFNKIKDRILAAIGDRLDALEMLIDWLTPMRKRQVEIVATLYAAWNNLMLDGNAHPSDQAIVQAARGDWHRDKLKILPGDFHEGLRDLRKQGVIPRGDGQYVRQKGA